MVRSNDVRISVKDLEKILGCLPAPQYVHLGLIGFRRSGVYADVLNLTKKLLPSGTEIDIESEPHIEIKNPTKDRILEFYKRWHGKTDALSPDFEVPGIDLQCIGWYRERPPLNVFLSSRGLEINYSGEPEIIRLRQELANSDIPMSIKY